MKNKDVVLAFLEKREAFGSNLFSTGQKLINYNTVLAEWYDNYHLIINDTYYSVTTSKNQCYLKREIIPNRGIVCYHVNNVNKNTQNLKLFIKTMKFQIDYLDANGVLTHYWTEALTKEEAERNLYKEMWDIDSILTIRQK